MSTSTLRRGLVAALAITCAAGLTACGSAVAKTGAPATTGTVLRLGAADTNNPELLAFVAAVESASHQRIRVQIDMKTYFSETPGGEARLAGALGAGDVDLGYLPSRDWAQAGAAGFDALQSPGLVTTTAQEIAVSKSPVADSLLTGLASKGVTGLALIPDEPRRLITTKPVLSTGDLTGRSIRIGDSTQTAAMISALGGTAVQGITAAQTKSKLLGGSLDGVETGPTPASQNNYNVPAPYLTSFGLIPKFEVLAASTGAWKRLSPEDRKVLQTAAAETVAKAATAVPAREADHLKEMCTNGLVVVQPAAAPVASIYAAAEKARPTSADAVSLIDRISSVVGTDAQSAAAVLPSGCVVATTAAAAEQQHRTAGGAPSSGADTHPQQLVGTYKIDVTAQQWEDGGVRGADWQTAVSFTWKLAADGTMTETQTPDFPDQGPVAGTWSVDGSRLHFVYGTPGTAENDFNETVSWSYFKGVLSLKVVDVQDQPSSVIYSVPWHKVA